MIGVKRFATWAMLLATATFSSLTADAQVEATDPSLTYGGRLTATVARGQTPLEDDNSKQVEQLAVGQVWGRLSQPVGIDDGSLQLRVGAAAEAKYTSWDSEFELAGVKVETEDQFRIDEAYVGVEYRGFADNLFVDLGWLEPAAASHGHVGKPEPLGTTSLYDGDQTFTQAGDIGGLGGALRGAAVRMGTHFGGGGVLVASYHNSLREDGSGSLDYDKERAVSATLSYEVRSGVHGSSIRFGVDYLKLHEDIHAEGHWGAGLSWDDGKEDGTWSVHVRGDRYGNTLPAGNDYEITRQLFSSAVQYQSEKWRYQIAAMDGKVEGRLASGNSYLAKLLRAAGAAASVESTANIDALLFGVGYALASNMEVSATIVRGAAKQEFGGQSVLDESDTSVALHFTIWR